MPERKDQPPPGGVFVGRKNVVRNRVGYRYNARNFGMGRFDVSGEIPGLRKRLIIETVMGGVKGWR
jgi:hypothetical protein